MKTIELTYPHRLNSNELDQTVAAIGFFDGIHRGHQKVIKTAVHQAKLKNMTSAVITFHPHPSVVLNDAIQHVKYITPIKEKQQILQKLDVDYLYIIKFNEELSQLMPKDFIEHFVKGLNINHLIAGFDFTFGNKGQGNMQNISEYANEKFIVTAIDQVSQHEVKISSTKIRECLKNGWIKEVNQLLGRAFSLNGIVVDGEKRGKTIGFPTANLMTSPDALLPMFGVYAVKVIYKGDYHLGIANIGIKPTFNNTQVDPTIEVHILNYEQNIYGEELTIEWHEFIRCERKFPGVDELVKQIKEDEAKVREYFSELVGK